MPVEFGVWRIDSGINPVSFGTMDLESRLEEILEKDISIASPNWMIIGRQVHTDWGARIDLLAIDQQGYLVVIELKRNKTPRDILAQALDYGSWVKTLKSDRIAKIYSDYRAAYYPKEPDQSLDEAFVKRFSLKSMPDELNDEHELVIVASILDPSTERIVKYLAEYHELAINALFFRTFKDGDREYLTRAWLSEPITPIADLADDDRRGEWNGEYYVSFGVGKDRDWDEAVKYGFVSGGGGSWYSNTLKMLEPGSRIWVNIPGEGYVGVGEVLEAAIPVDEFHVTNNVGNRVPLLTVSEKAGGMHKAADNLETAEYLVRVKWLKTVPIEKAVKEKGFFGNQNTVAKPKTPKWNHTVERLKKRFGIE
jgi:hypothetical protein